VLRRGIGEFKGEWQEVFRTERLHNTRNPKFETILRLNYFKTVNERAAKEPQPIRFVLADDQHAWQSTKLLTEKDAFAMIETTIEEIISACEDGPGLFVKMLNVTTIKRSLTLDSNVDSGGVLPFATSENQPKKASSHGMSITLGNVEKPSISILAAVANITVNCPPLGAESSPAPAPGGKMRRLLEASKDFHRAQKLSKAGRWTSRNSGLSPQKQLPRLPSGSPDQTILRTLLPRLSSASSDQKQAVLKNREATPADRTLFRTPFSRLPSAASASLERSRSDSNDYELPAPTLPYVPRPERWMAQFRTYVLSKFKAFTALGQNDCGDESNPRFWV
jgi:hypothetical protein